MTEQHRPSDFDWEERAVRRAFNPHRNPQQKRAAEQEVKDIFDQLLGRLPELQSAKQADEAVSDSVDDPRLQHKTSAEVERSALQAHTMPSEKATVADSRATVAEAAVAPYSGETEFVEIKPDAPPLEFIPIAAETSVAPPTSPHHSNHSAVGRAASEAAVISEDENQAATSAAIVAARLASITRSGAREQTVGDAAKANVELPSENLQKASEIKPESAPQMPSVSSLADDTEDEYEDDEIHESTEFLFHNEFRSKRDWLMITADKAKILLLLDSAVVVGAMVAGALVWEVREMLMLPFALLALGALVSLSFALRAAAMNSADRAVFSVQKYWQAVEGGATELEAVHTYLKQELHRLDDIADKQIRLLNSGYAVFYLSLQVAVWIFVAVRFVFYREG